MNIQAQKIKLAKMIFETDNPNILESVKNILVTAKQQDFWEIMSDEQKLDIERSIAEIVCEDKIQYTTLTKKLKIYIAHRFLEDILTMNFQKIQSCYLLKF